MSATVPTGDAQYIRCRFFDDGVHGLGIHQPMLFTIAFSKSVVWRRRWFVMSHSDEIYLREDLRRPARLCLMLFNPPTARKAPTPSAGVVILYEITISRSLMSRVVG